MSDIQLYLFEVDKDKAEAKNVARRSAQKLETKDLKLIDLITSLEEYINNKDDATVRGHSIAYLADVLNAVGPRVLSNQERRLLCDFVLGRIEGDVEGIGSSARALLALEERGKWDAATSQKVLNTFVSHATPLKPPADRYAAGQVPQTHPRIARPGPHVFAEFHCFLRWRKGSQESDDRLLALAGTDDGMGRLELGPRPVRLCLQLLPDYIQATAR
jgi:hypothetical protein